LIGLIAEIQEFTVANSKSALKRVRQNKVRRERNRVVRSRTRTIERKFNEAVEAGDKAVAEETFKAAATALDRAASKGVIPKKRASRKIGRMAKRLDAIG
jgi:small subunit ribosomal protein S20